jgi:hypothetical protein
MLAYSAETEVCHRSYIIAARHCLALKQFYIKNVGPAKIQRVQQKIPGCRTYVQQNENKFQKVCDHSCKIQLA